MEVCVRRFNSHTEEDNFSGFCEQEEDEDSILWLFLPDYWMFFLSSRVTGNVQKKQLWYIKNLQYVAGYCYIFQ